VGGSLLVPRKHELNIRIHGFQGIKNRERGSARISEDVLYSCILQALNQRLCAIHLWFDHIATSVGLKLRYSGQVHADSELRNK
jgi:hypothetical protein